jgi:CheY-like chemotaxis protein
MPGRILIVDDYRNTAEIIGRWVQRSDKQREVKTAVDGLQALQTAEEFLPDLILLDIHIPKISGFEVAQKIRQQPWGAGIVLIALSGWISPDDRQRIQESGFNALLLKPLNYEELSRLLVEFFPTNR